MLKSTFKSMLGLAVGLCLPMAFAFVSHADTITDVVLTIDVSGSIDNAELELEVDGLCECLEEMAAAGDDKIGVGIVVYGSSSAVVQAITSLNSSNKQSMCDLLQGLLSDRIVGTGSTNIEAGIDSAAGLLAGGTDQDHIILIGDGAANAGDTDTPCSSAGTIPICAIAVGADEAGEDELQQCANDTGGEFFVGEFADFAELCHECMHSILVGACTVNVYPNDPGACEATVSCDSIVSVVDLFGDPVVGLALDCDPDGPYPVGSTDVTVTASADGYSPNPLVIQCTVVVEDTEDPQISCNSVGPVECDGAGNLADIEAWLHDPSSPLFGASATDNCSVDTIDGSLTGFTPDPNCGNSGAGTYTAVFTATDASGNTSQTECTLTVVDTTAPTINCTNPGTIIPPDAPITFCMTADDVCCGDAPEVVITGFRCYEIKSNGKVIDKGESCEVTIDGNCITIWDSGGVNDHITWHVVATDCCGNVSEADCEVVVVNPGKK
ncbi:MAG: VWA domain-containing protein [bacterium]